MKENDEQLSDDEDVETKSVKNG